MATSQDTSASAQKTPQDLLCEARELIYTAHAMNDMVTAVYDVGGEGACQEGTLKVALIHGNELLEQANELIGKVIAGGKQQEGDDNE